MVLDGVGGLWYDKVCDAGYKCFTAYNTPVPDLFYRYQKQDVTDCSEGSLCNQRFSNYDMTADANTHTAGDAGGARG